MSDFPVYGQLALSPGSPSFQNASHGRPLRQQYERLPPAPSDVLQESAPRPGQSRPSGGSARFSMPAPPPLARASRQSLDLASSQLLLGLQSGEIGSSMSSRSSPEAPVRAAAGQLKVHILKASGLRKADLYGKSDPYCICEVGSAAKPHSGFETKCIKKTLDPEWNEENVFDTFNEGDGLHLTVNDKDAYHQSDDSLGTFSLKFEQIYPNGFYGPLHLTDPKSKKNARPTLTVRISVQLPGDTKWRSPRAMDHDMELKAAAAPKQGAGLSGYGGSKSARSFVEMERARGNDTRLSLDSQGISTLIDSRGTHRNSLNSYGSIDASITDRSSSPESPPQGREASESPLRSKTTAAVDSNTEPSEVSETIDFGDITAKMNRRRPPKVNWNPWLTHVANLSGSSEQCACGSVFLGDDTFCYRCGVRRPVDVMPLPLHVPRMLEPPIEDVGERMIAWHEAYSARKDALQKLKRENQEAADTAAHQGMPHINPLSQDLAADLKPISERYKGVIWMKEFSLQKRREEIGKEKAEAYVLNPKILARSMSLERGVEDLLEWRKKRDRKVDRRREHGAELLMRQCTFQPSLGHCAKRSSSARGVPVHDRLYTDATLREKNLKVEQEACHADWKLSQLARAKDASRCPKAKPPQVDSRKQQTENKVPGSLLRRAKSNENFEPGHGFLPSKARTPRAGEKGSDRSPVLRGPRASLACLSSKISAALNGKRGATPRRKRDGSVESEPHQRSSFCKSHLCDRERAVVRPRAEKSVWTGGQNNIIVKDEFKPLMERCQRVHSVPDEQLDSDAALGVNLGTRSLRK